MSPFRRTLPKLGTFSRQILAHNVELAALGRAGDLAAARRLFDAMPAHDVASWNALLTAHWRLNDIEGSKRIFADMPERTVVTWNSIVTGCLENGSPDDALRYFNTMPVKNVASWNAMLSGLLKLGWFEEARKVFDEMPERNVVSYTAMMDGLARRGEVERARELFDWMPERNSVSWAAMISGYVENGRMVEAEELFGRMKVRNVVAVTAMITGYCKEGKVGRARQLFDGLRERDVVSWNAMMSGYANNGDNEEALELHVQMLKSGAKPDHATLVVVLIACSALALLQRGRQTHAIVIKTRLESNISLCNTLITMYSKCGSISDSEAVFEKIQIRDVVTWNTFIAACAQHGHYQKALALFHDMDANGLLPNGITFLCVLSACGHAGKVNESLNWFHLMGSKYGIYPRSEHYACLVDILSRAGRLRQAYEYIRDMPFEAEGSVWGALLGACQMYSNVELGELAAEKLIQLDPQKSGAYVMLSNIYAQAGMWGEVTRVRGLMKEHGVKKQPGYSWTEIADEVHLFLVGDSSHPDIDKIYSELERISLHMIKAIAEDEPYIFG